MKLPRFFFCLCIGSLWGVLPVQADPPPTPEKPLATVESPNGRNRVVVADWDFFSFDILVDGKKILDMGPVGILLPDKKYLGSNGKPKDTVDQRSVDETWRPVTGKTSTVRDHFNEITIHDRFEFDYSFDLVIRAYDDGVAFRYVVTKPPKGEPPPTVSARELAPYDFPSDNLPCWYADYVTDGSSQEATFKAGRLRDIKPDAKVGMPLLVQVRPDVCVALTEADVKDWPGSRFHGRSEGAKGTLRLEAVQGPNLQVERPSVDDSPYQRKALFDLKVPSESPWRVIMIGKTPGELIASNLVENLNPPSKIEDTSWIKPGMSSWDWWSGRSRMETGEIKKFIQLSADMGWPYMLLDAGWSYHEGQPDSDLRRTTDGLDMPELLRFAKEKGVRLWLWMSWRDVLRNGAYKKAFPVFRDWGIAGVKIDYMDREDQWMVDFYHTMFQATAENHLMLDLHGAYKPTGARRTWPNFITQEGVLGNEQNRGSRTDTARHNVTIPYTRMLLGPMDYTPGGFVNQTPAQFQPTDHGTTVPNTRGQELAKFVVFESPLQMACDYPDNYRDQPGADFLQLVKTSWDEVRFLGGEVGEFIVLARRSGDDWFIGGMTNEDARKVDVKLDFLPAGKPYLTTIWRDAPEADRDATKLVREEKNLAAANTLSLSMAPAGGFVMHLTPQR